MKVHKILVPLDGSPLAEKALPVALKLAKQCKAELLLLRSTKIGTISPDVVESELEVITTAQDYLESVRQNLISPATPNNLQADQVRTIVAYDEPMREIPELATFEKANLIVMTTHGRSGLPRLVLGSAASRIVQNSALPVILIRPETLNKMASLPEILNDSDAAEVDEGKERIVVTLDGTLESEKALEPAAALAHQLNATVYLLQVIKPYVPLDYAGVGVPYVYDEKSLEQENAIRREAAYKYLGEVQAILAAAGLQCVRLVRQGDAASVIAGYAQMLQASLLVMATHARSNTGRILLGSVAEEVMRLSNLPVMMVNIRRYSLAESEVKQAVEAAS